MVLLFSSRSNTSQQVLREVERGRQGAADPAGPDRGRVPLARHGVLHQRQPLARRDRRSDGGAFAVARPAGAGADYRFGADRAARRRRPPRQLRPHHPARSRFRLRSRPTRATNTPGAVKCRRPARFHSPGGRSWSPALLALVVLIVAGVVWIALKSRGGGDLAARLPPGKRRHAPGRRRCHLTDHTSRCGTCRRAAAARRADLQLRQRHRRRRAPRPHPRPRRERAPESRHWRTGRLRPRQGGRRAQAQWRRAHRSSATRTRCGSSAC